MLCSEKCEIIFSNMQSELAEFQVSKHNNNNNNFKKMRLATWKWDLGWLYREIIFYKMYSDLALSMVDSAMSQCILEKMILGFNHPKSHFHFLNFILDSDRIFLFPHSDVSIDAAKSDYIFQKMMLGFNLQTSFSFSELCFFEFGVFTVILTVKSQWRAILGSKVFDS